MAANYHHGPEVIERREGAGIVREVKSAVTMLVGTAPIHLVHADAQARAPFINKRVVIRTLADGIAAFGPETAGYTIPQALRTIFAKAVRGQGGGTIVVVNVFDPAIHKDEDDQPDPSAVSANDIIGTYDLAGQAKGWKLAYGAFNTLGYFPKILIAPGFTGIAGVRAEMLTIANKIHAMAPFDLPVGLTIQQAVEARGVAGAYNMASERAILLYPHVKAYDPVIEDVSLQPFSQHFAGVMIATDLADGYHHSPSNREMSDVLGLEREITFYPGDYQSDTNALNEVGITTVMNMFGSGFRTWGNRSAAFPTSITMHNFIHARRILDQVHESALYYLMQRTDSLATPANVEIVEEDVNAFLRKKEGDGALYGGRFTFDRTRTTSRDVADGHLYYRLEMMPVGVMERLTVDSYLDIDFARNALGLAS